MRVSTKLALGLTLTSSIILGSYGYWHLRAEEQNLRATAEHDLRLLGTAVQVSVEHALRDNQLEDVHHVLNSLERKDSDIDVFVFDLGGKLTAHSSRSATPHARLEGPMRDLAQTGHSVIQFEGLSELIAALPLRDNGTRVGAVALVKPLHDLRRDLKATRLSLTLSILTQIVAISLFGWLLVFVQVRLPLAEVVKALRAIRQGDLTARVAADRADEVGEVAFEFDSMAKELETMRQKLVGEVEARETLEAGLKRVDKLVTVGQLSAGLAHEIGSPLQILNGRARALAARLDLPAELHRSAQILVEQSDRIAKIVEQLLNFSRRKPARLRETDIASAVTAVVDLLEAEAGRRGVLLSMDCDSSLPRVLADADQLQQVALNLLSNALRATPPGGAVQVRLARAPETHAKPSLTLTVEDTGVGIAEDVQAKIFEPFFTTGTDAGGTGLGLAVVKSIVTDHGGTLSVASSLGRGSCFTVKLPLAYDPKVDRVS